jgi:hypothetical protein
MPSLITAVTLALRLALEGTAAQQLAAVRLLAVLALCLWLAH